MNEIINSRFIPSHIRKNILENKLYKYRFKVKDNITIEIITLKELYEKKGELFKNCEEIIKLFYSIFYNINKKFCKIHYIYLFPFDYKKTVDKCIKENNINSAVSMVYNGKCGGPILIYRDEEMEKVLIHELLHSFNYDIHLANKSGLCNKIMKTHLCDNDYNNEGIVECNAQILSPIFYSIIKGEKIDLKKIIKEEIENGENNCIKLKNNMEKWCQKTSAFSYYVIKTIVMKKIFYEGDFKYLALNQFPCIKGDFIEKDFDFLKKKIKDKSLYINMAKFKWR